MVHSITVCVLLNMPYHRHVLAGMCLIRHVLLCMCLSSSWHDISPHVSYQACLIIGMCLSIVHIASHLASSEAVSI